MLLPLSPTHSSPEAESTRKRRTGDREAVAPRARLCASQRGSNLGAECRRRAPEGIASGRHSYPDLPQHHLPGTLRAGVEDSEESPQTAICSQAHSFPILSWKASSPSSLTRGWGVQSFLPHSTSCLLAPSGFQPSPKTPENANLRLARTV